MVKEVMQYLDHKYDYEYDSIMEEEKDIVLVCGRHWQMRLYMIGLRLEVEVDKGYYIDEYDIEFFHKVNQDIEEIADLYHKRD
jgi:hypothetical protein